MDCSNCGHGLEHKGSDSGIQIAWCAECGALHTFNGVAEVFEVPHRAALKVTEVNIVPKANYSAKIAGAPIVGVDWSQGIPDYLR